ncbi:MAG: histidine phosphatase family protein, partial [Actinomycetes bacterium]
AAEHHGGRHISAIYVTSLQRTHETAAPLAALLDLEPNVEADLREVHLGDWEGGALRLRAAAGDPLFAQLVAEERWDVIPGAEPAADFAARVSDGLGRIADAHPDQTVVAVVHGGVIGQLLATATGRPGFAFAGSDNTGISELVVERSGRWVVRRFNDTAHLDLPGWPDPAA